MAAADAPHRTACPEQTRRRQLERDPFISGEGSCEDSLALRKQQAHVFIRNAEPVAGVDRHILYQVCDAAGITDLSSTAHATGG